ncbi:MAG: VOC family protein [Gammaproteobacteria bacterium]|jgi:catechol 2,3-dioxygenase-like lactoylglutathione lyase family enzyme
MSLKLKSLDYVVLIVRELDVSVGFYHGILGLPLRHRAASYAQIDSGATRLGLFTQAAMAATLDRAVVKGTAGEAFELGFFVDDCDAAYAELAAAGVPLVAPPTTREWGQRTAYVSDPDGNLIELVQERP